MSTRDLVDLEGVDGLEGLVGDGDGRRAGTDQGAGGLGGDSAGEVVDDGGHVGDDELIARLAHGTERGAHGLERADDLLLGVVLLEEAIDVLNGELADGAHLGVLGGHQGRRRQSKGQDDGHGDEEGGEDVHVGTCGGLVSG